MANSKYEYVRAFEQPDSLIPNTFIVVRIDGRGFTKLTTKYEFVKPNDRRALDLMNLAAEAVMKDLPDLVLAYGQSDEFSFVFHKDCMLFERRSSKLVTTIVSTFTANYVLGWSRFFPDAPLTSPLPTFDGRAVCYPSNANLRDYLSWRQADCHINNLYNTTFWALVQQGGLSRPAAERELSGTVSSEKNEILFSRFGINYNNEPEIFKKGSVLYRDFFPTSTQSSPIPPKSTISPSFRSHPSLQKATRPMSQPLEGTTYDMFRSSPNSGGSTGSGSTTRGPTFLSTSTTPSPPPSPPSMSIPTFVDSFENKQSLGYPHNGTPLSPANGSIHRHQLPPLTPIPLPPPTLKPSTRPPPSLAPPNPTNRTNTSPFQTPKPNSPVPTPTRTTSNSKRSVKPASHSASASLSYSSRPTYRPAPKRSPSMSALEFRSPPQIPVRISSIPLDAAPRKLSLPTQKSYGMLRGEERDHTLRENMPTTYPNSTAYRPRTPPHQHLRTMKELPSPPTDEIGRPPSSRGSGHGEMEGLITNPVIPPSPPQLSTHSRSVSAYSFHAPPPNSRLNHFKPLDWEPGLPPKDDAPQLNAGVRAGENKVKKGKKGKQKEEEGGWLAGVEGNEGRPVAMSKTKREKERKKRGKAKVVCEHVDIIGNAFWEKRPWILSGKTGT